jgi:hypothetical protein
LLSAEYQMMPHHLIARPILMTGENKSASRIMHPSLPDAHATHMMGNAYLR